MPRVPPYMRLLQPQLHTNACTAAFYTHTHTHISQFTTLLHRNLVFLKRYHGDSIEDLCLTFTVTDEAFGSTTETELVPGGASRSVTARNRLEYVNRVAKYYLVDRVSATVCDHCDCSML
jgi:HECT-domain (ubiquitin-transferase)